MKQEQKEAGSGILNVAEAAVYFRRCTSWVYKKVNAGFLPHIRIGRSITFDKADLQKWVDGHKKKGCLKV